MFSFSYGYSFTNTNKKKFINFFDYFFETISLGFVAYEIFIIGFWSLAFGLRFLICRFDSLIAENFITKTRDQRPKI